MIASVRKVTRRWDRLMLNTWLFEVAAILFSAASLVTIAIVLRVYDGKTQPQMPFHLTLNAIVSVLSTASKSALICGVAGAVGQLKWVWFRKSRKLQDIQRFDDASRGPLGALVLLGSHHFKALASIGALVTVFALAFDPFVQQVIQYPLRPVSSPHSDAVMAKNSIFSVSYGYGGSAPSSYRALEAGIYSYDSLQVSPSCPTGHCKWPPYRSAELCVECTDAMPYASISECDTAGFWHGRINNLTCYLSFGYGDAYEISVGEIDDTARRITVTNSLIWTISKAQLYQPKPNGRHQNSTIPIKTNKAFPEVPHPGLVLGHAELYGEDEAPKITMAEECVITHCAKDYSLEMSGGRADAKVLRTYYGLYRKAVPTNGYDICWQPEPGSITYKQAPMGFLPTIDPFDPDNLGRVNRSRNAVCPANSVLDLISQNIQGRWTYTCHANPDGGPIIFCTSPSPAMPILAESDPLDASKSGFQPGIKRIVASLNKLNLDVSNETVTGNATVQVPYVRIEWVWLSLPLALETMGILFLATAILLTRIHEIQLWKSSVLPLLFYGLGDGSVRTDSVSADLCAMDRVAQETRVKLVAADERHEGDEGPTEGKLLLGGME